MTPIMILVEIQPCKLVPEICNNANCIVSLQPLDASHVVFGQKNMNKAHLHFTFIDLKSFYYILIPSDVILNICKESSRKLEVVKISIELSENGSGGYQTSLIKNRLKTLLHEKRIKPSWYLSHINRHCFILKYVWAGKMEEFKTRHEGGQHQDMDRKKPL